MGELETQETKAAFDYIKQEIISKIDETKDASFMEAIGMSKSDLPQEDLFLFTTRALLMPNHAATIKLIIDKSDTFTEFIVMFYYYTLIFNDMKKQFPDVDIIDILKTFNSSL